MLLVNGEEHRQKHGRSLLPEADTSKTSLGFHCRRTAPDGAGGSACPPKYFGGHLASNRQERPHTWSIGTLEVSNWAGRGSITVRWIARRPDQSLLWDFLDSYLVAIEENRWQILGDVVHNL